MPKPKTRRSVFTKTNKVDTSSSGSVSLQATPSVKLYRSIHQIPLDRLITCKVDKDLSALIIEGEPDPEELVRVWNSIDDAFMEKMQDDDQKYIQKLAMDYNILQSKCNAIDVLIEALRWMYRKEWADDLTKWYGMQVNLKPDNKEGNLRTLSLVEARKNRWLADGVSLQNEMTKLAPNSGGTELTREYFDMLIVAISRFNKYHVNKKETTGSEFIIMIQDMRAAAKQIESFSKN